MNNSSNDGTNSNHVEGPALKTIEKRSRRMFCHMLLLVAAVLMVLLQVASTDLGSLLFGGEAALVRKSPQHQNASSHTSQNLNNEGPVVEDDPCSWEEYQHLPTLFVHPGPPKTGTTSLQDWMACNANSIAEQYNAYYLGKVNPKNIKKCLTRKDERSTLLQAEKNFDVGRYSVQSPDDEGPRKRLGQALRHHMLDAKPYQNVVLSNEDMHAALYSIHRAMTEHLDDTNQTSTSTTMQGQNPFSYRMVVAIGYRPYHAWLHSSYAFTLRPKWYESKDKWSDDETVPTFPEFVRQEVSAHASSVDDAPNLHPSYRLQRKLENLFGSKSSSASLGGRRLFCSHTLSLSQGRNVVSEFEQLLHHSVKVQSGHDTDQIGVLQRSLSSGAEETTNNPEDSTSTGARITQRSSSEQESSSTNVHTNTDKGTPFETDAEVIAVRLYHDGWVAAASKNSNRRRRAVVQDVQAQLEGMFRDPRVSQSSSVNLTSQVLPPWICIDKEDLEMVQKATIRVDQEMERGGTANLQESLQFWIDSHVHCSVDYDRLFTNSSSTEEQEWDQFRHCLREETASSKPCTSFPAT